MNHEEFERRYESACERFKTAEAKRALVKGYVTTVTSSAAVYGWGGGPLAAPVELSATIVAGMNTADSILHAIRKFINPSQDMIDCQTWLQYQQQNQPDKAKQIVEEHEEEVDRNEDQVNSSWNDYANSFSPDDPHAPVRANDRPRFNDARVAAAMKEIIASQHG